MSLRSYRLFSLLALFLVLVSSAPAADPKLEFQIIFDSKVSVAPFTGRVYVMLSKNKMNEPPGGPNWFRPEPFFARDVKDWRPGEPIVLGDEAISFPAALSKTKAGAYYGLAI